MEVSARIFIAGHKGLVGSALVRSLTAKGFKNLVLRDRSELDLINQAQVNSFFETEKIDYVIHAAAKVGGILFNQKFQAEFLYENLMVSANVIKAAADNGVKKLLYLGSSCIYPKLAAQPISEDALLTGPLEPTNEGYALAKIAGLKLCEKYHLQHGKAFISVMPTNLFGPGDNFHPERSHVIPGMMRRFHEAKVSSAPEVVIWGTGRAMREFLHIDDLAEAVFILMQRYEESSTINVGTGQDCTILELAETMREVVGFTGELKLDRSKPDGTPRKVLDVTKISNLGWKPGFSLRDGLADTYRWALENQVFNQ